MKIALTLAALVAWVSLSAQTKTIQGTVYDENGIGMVGVAVYDEADLAGGVITDDKGRFAIEVSSTCKELRASFMGYMLEIVPLDKASKIRMKPNTQSIQETVVTGIFTRKKDSFTGSVQTISSEDIKRVSNQNLIQSLKNLDPSLLVLENLEQGSNPNSVANIQMRGAPTLDAETASLKSGYLNWRNPPLIILDGFETTLQQMQDMGHEQNPEHYPEQRRIGEGNLRFQGSERSDCPRDEGIDRGTLTDHLHRKPFHRSP